MGPAGAAASGFQKEGSELLVHPLQQLRIKAVANRKALHLAPNQIQGFLLLQVLRYSSARKRQLSSNVARDAGFLRSQKLNNCYPGRVCQRFSQAGQLLLVFRKSGSFGVAHVVMSACPIKTEQEVWP